MFAIKLASIEDLKRLEQRVSECVGLSNAIKVFKSMVNPFDGLFNSFLPLVLTFFINISQSSELSLG